MFFQLKCEKEQEKKEEKLKQQEKEQACTIRM